MPESSSTPNPNPVPANPKFDFHKVFAALGIILSAAIIILAAVWILTGGTSSTNDTNDGTVKVTTSSATPAETIPATNSSTSQ